MRRLLWTIAAAIFGLACFHCPLGASGDGVARAGWRYSSSYRPGYNYYGSCYYGGYYYSPGYWYYEPVQIAAYYVPVYLPAVFDTYQVQSLKTYNTLGIAAVANLTATPGAAEVTDTITTRRTSALVGGGVQTGVNVQSGGSTAGSAGARLDAMERDIAEIKRLLQSGGASKPPAEPVPAPKEGKKEGAAKKPAPVQALITNCAGCHDKKVANQPLLDDAGAPKLDKDGQPALKGGGFVYFEDGEPTDWSDYQITRLYKVLLNGSMPKGSKLPDADGQAIAAYLDGLLDRRKAKKGS
jgi:hypothetical protein